MTRHPPFPSPVSSEERVLLRGIARAAETYVQTHENFEELMHSVSTWHAYLAQHPPKECAS